MSSANEDKWIALTHKRIQNWHYACWPVDRTKAPLVYPHVIQDYYRAAKGKTVGTFINGESRLWQRQHLSLYCWMKILWNPDFNVDAMLDEYARRMYGPAAPQMRELIQIESDGWEKSRWPGARLTAKAIYTISYPSDARKRMRELVQQIRAKTNDDPILKARADYDLNPLDAFFADADAFEHADRTSADRAARRSRSGDRRQARRRDLVSRQARAVCACI